VNIKVAEIPRLIVSILICLIAGFLGSLATIPSIPTWYASLTKTGLDTAKLAIRPDLDHTVHTNGLSSISCVA